MRVIGVKKDRRLRVKTLDRIKNREIEVENRFVREFRQPVVLKDYHVFPAERSLTYLQDRRSHICPEFSFLPAFDRQPGQSLVRGDTTQTTDNLNANKIFGTSHFDETRSTFDTVFRGRAKLIESECCTLSR